RHAVARDLRHDVVGVRHCPATVFESAAAILVRATGCLHHTVQRHAVEHHDLAHVVVLPSCRAAGLRPSGFIHYTRDSPPNRHDEAASSGFGGRKPPAIVAAPVEPVAQALFPRRTRLPGVVRGTRVGLTFLSTTSWSMTT